MFYIRCYDANYLQMDARCTKKSQLHSNPNIVNIAQCSRRLNGKDD